jgi:hypothetical protein
LKEIKLNEIRLKYDSDTKFRNMASTDEEVEKKKTIK